MSYRPNDCANCGCDKINTICEYESGVGYSWHCACPDCAEKTADFSTRQEALDAWETANPE